MGDNDNLRRGRRAAHKVSCGCPACRWRRRTAEDKAWLENSTGQARDAETMRILEEARRERKAQLQEQALSQAHEYNKAKLDTNTIAEAAAGNSGSTDGVATPLGRGGSQVFSSGAVDSAVVDDYLLPRGAVVDLPGGGAQGPGSPRTDDRPAPDTQVSPPKPAVLVGLDATVLECQQCGFVGNGPAREKLHKCTGPWWGATCEQWKIPRS